MPRTLQHRSEQGNFDCVIPDDLPDFYADGVTQLQLGVPMSRILFHSVIAPADGTEQTPVEHRLAKLSLAIPTAALFELVANIATGANKEAVAQTQGALALYSTAFAQQLARVAALAPDQKS